MKLFPPKITHKNLLTFKKRNGFSWKLGNFRSHIRFNWLFFEREFNEIFSPNEREWNVVNLGIAGFALYNISTIDISSLSYSQSLNKLQNLDKILLFNARLDIGCIATDVCLWERGLRKDSKRLEGYGKSMLLQDGLLLVFDLILYILHNPYTKGQLSISENFEFTATGFRVSF